MRKLRLLTLSILLVAAVIATAAYTKKKNDDYVFPPKEHHVIYAEWTTEKDGTKTLRAIRVRDVDVSGAWKEWSANRKFERTTLSDHSDQSKPGNFIASSDGYRSAAFFRSLPHLVREETILGYPCFTLDLNGAQTSFSPEFGMTPLKFVSDGGTVLEALKIY
jgi:hypothetical protein